MALTLGIPVDSATSLAAFLDLVYANRSLSLVSANAVFTPLEPNRIVIGWPGYDDVVYLTLAARPTNPENILYQ